LFATGTLVLGAIVLVSRSAMPSFATRRCSPPTVWFGGLITNRSTSYDRHAFVPEARGGRDDRAILVDQLLRRSCSISFVRQPAA
jgi:hypothetical protein